MTDITTTTAEATPSIADAFTQLRAALFSAPTTSHQKAAIDAMQAHFEARETAIEARLTALEEGVILLSTGAPKAPIDPIRPGAGTVVTAPVPVAPLPQTDPSPATDVASASNILSVMADQDEAGLTPPPAEPTAG